MRHLHQRRRREVQASLDRINLQLDLLAEAHPEPTWDHLVSLNHVLHRLLQVEDFLAGDACADEAPLDYERLMDSLSMGDLMSA